MLLTYSKLSEAKWHNELNKLFLHFQGKVVNAERMTSPFFGRIKKKKCSVLFPPSLSIIFRPNELMEIHEDKGSFYKVIQEVREFGHLMLDSPPQVNHQRNHTYTQLAAAAGSRYYLEKPRVLLQAHQELFCFTVFGFMFTNPAQLRCKPRMPYC